MDNRAKVLVILSPGFPKNEADTTCLPPQQVFVRTLKKEYPKLNIIVLSFQYPFTAAEYEWHRVKVIAFGGQSKGKLARRKLWVNVWRTLLQLNRRYQITGLLSFWLDECAYVAHYFSKYKNIRHRCWMLGQDVKPGNKYVSTLNPNGQELIALSDFMAHTFDVNYGVKPHHVIPVGVDAKMFKSGPIQKDIEIIGAGSLIPLKRYHLLVEAVAVIKQFYPHIKAVICGDGPEKENLQAMLSLKKLDENIELIGELRHHEVIATMQRSKILFHPSEYEGFGAVCSEALFAGAQVVSFVKPMNDEIPNWHIASNMENAINRMLNILGNENFSFEPVLTYDIRDNVKRMMSLFE